MCITSETCRANSVIKTTLNNLHQAGPNKTHIWWCMETQKSNSSIVLVMHGNTNRKFHGLLSYGFPNVISLFGENFPFWCILITPNRMNSAADVNDASCYSAVSDRQVRSIDHSWYGFCFVTGIWYGRSRWPRGLRRRSAAARMLRLWVRIPPGAWMFVVMVVCCQVEVSCDELITRPEESYRLCCVGCMWSRKTSWMGRP